MPVNLRLKILFGTPGTPISVPAYISVTTIAETPNFRDTNLGASGQKFLYRNSVTSPVESTIEEVSGAIYISQGFTFSKVRDPSINVEIKSI